MSDINRYKIITKCREVLERLEGRIDDRDGKMVHTTEV